MQTDREELSPKAKARRAPHTPGVYLMKDAAGLVVYVGKAKDLKKRLASYFVPRQRMTPKVAAMMDTVVDMEWHEVRSETEALLLEGPRRPPPPLPHRPRPHDRCLPLFRSLPSSAGGPPHAQ